jgi:hypothetical protein
MALPVCPGRDSTLLAGVVVVAEQVVLVRRGEGDVSFLDVGLFYFFEKRWER